MEKNKSINELNGFPNQYFLWIILVYIVLMLSFIIYTQYWLWGIIIFILGIYFQIMINGGRDKESDLEKSLKKFKKNEKQIR